jgi:Family of unknown function (DUF5771)
MPRAKAKAKKPVRKNKTLTGSKSKKKIARSAKGKPIILLDKDEHYLSNAGYAISKSEAARRAALRKAIDKKAKNEKIAKSDAIRKTLRRVNVLRTYRKDQYPGQAERVAKDVKFLSGMLARENAKLARSVKSKTKSKSKTKAKVKSKAKAKSKSKRKTVKARSKKRK